MLALALALSSGIARCAHRNCPVRLTASVRSQSAQGDRLAGRGGSGDAGVVDERVEAAEFGLDVVEKPRHRRGIGHVAHARGHAIAASAASARVVHVADVHPRAFAEERVDGREADAGGAGRHQDAQAVESSGPWRGHRQWKRGSPRALRTRAEVEYNCGAVAHARIVNVGRSHESTDEPRPPRRHPGSAPRARHSARWDFPPSAAARRRRSASAT